MAEGLRLQVRGSQADQSEATDMVRDESGIVRMIVSDGYAYSASNMGIQELFAAVNKQPVLAPAVGANIGASSYASIYLLYDNVNKCFMSCCPIPAGPFAL